jgi:hypothetical protein
MESWHPQSRFYRGPERKEKERAIRKQSSGARAFQPAATNEVVARRELNRCVLKVWALLRTRMSARRSAGFPARSNERTLLVLATSCVGSKS